VLWGVSDEGNCADMAFFSQNIKETMNYWKQEPHIMKYFRAEEDPTASVPKSWMKGFLEVK